MAFANTTVSTSNHKLEEKKLKERISFLGKKMDEAQEQAAVYKNITAKKEQTEKELADLKHELQKVKKELLDTENEYKESLKSNELFGASVVNYQKEQDAEIKKGKEIKDKLDTELFALRSEKTQVEKEIAEFEKNIAEKQKTYDVLAAEHEKLARDNDAVKKSLLNTQHTLLSATEELGNMLHSVEQEQEKFTELASVADVKQKQVVSLGNQIANFEAKLNAVKTLIAEEEKKVKHILEAEKLKVTEREGDITLRESWLKEKEESLRKFHRELEKFFGKNININV